MGMMCLIHSENDGVIQSDHHSLLLSRADSRAGTEGRGISCNLICKQQYSMCNLWSVISTSQDHLDA